MTEEEFEECSVVSYPHKIIFLHIKGGRISYYVDRHISDYVNKIQQENQELKKQLEKKYEKVGTLTTEILYEENTRLTNEITVLKTENQKLKEMQCTFLGSGCQNKMKKYKEVIGKIRKICESVPVSWSVCGIDVVAKIEKALKEVE